ncbi:MAG: DoxX family membrane protein [Propionibacterium sp.]
MSTTDKTESLYDSVSTPADAEEQSGTVAPAANQAPDQEHGTESAVAAPAVAETPSVQAVPAEALAAKTPADTSAVTAPADGPKSVPSVPSEPQAPQQAAVETSTAPAEPSASAPEPSAAEDTATTDTEPPAAQSQTASAPAAAPRPIPTPQSVPSPERAAVSAGEAATVAWKKDGDAAQEATRQTAVTASNGAARRAAQASAAAEPAQQEAQSRDNQAAQAEQAAQAAQEDRTAKAEQAAQAEQQEAEQRAQEKAERDRRLGTVRADEQPETVVAATVPRPTTDRFAGSVGLFVLRVVTTALVGVFGFQALTQRQPVIDAIAKIGVPRANLVAWGLAGLLLLVAAMILFGLGTRVAGFILAALGVLSLVFVKWGAFNPFHQGQPGFSGDIDLVLAAIGWALLFVGAGGWSLDAGIRRSRAQKKLDGQV